MLKNIEVIIDEKSLEMYESSKNIIGEICFKIDNEYFPQKGWTDFVVVVLGWWLEAISSISSSRKNASFKLRFMDGPLLVRGLKTDEDVIDLEFVDREKVLFRTICSIKQLTESLADASKKVMSDIEKREWETRDTSKLKSVLAYMKK